MENSLRVLYEDNHLIIVNKRAGDIVQGDKTGDVPLSEHIKLYIKEKYAKPGDVFLGTIHRLDRPVSGVVAYAKTSKALARMNKLFAEKTINKSYWAIVDHSPNLKEAELVHFLSKNEKQNKSYVSNSESKSTKKAVLQYRQLAQSEHYTLLEIELKTGRHHQIRAQLAHIQSVIKGDVKYGAKRPNKDASICLHARRLSFVHPIKNELLNIIAPVPENDSLWAFFENSIQ
jgi:23S rRNA pseudouridine1911/1915/1917 synthase